jgi:hypothetical protein
MPIPKDYQFRKGDVVTVRGVIQYSRHEGSIYAFIQSEHNPSKNIGVDPEDIADVVSFNLQAKDRVLYTKHGEEYGTVIHANGEFAWVELDEGGRHRLIELTQLQRVDWEPATVHFLPERLPDVSNDDVPEAPVREVGGQVA